MLAEPQPDVQESGTVGREYDDLAAFFDAFAPQDEHWQHRNRTYHRLIRQLYEFQVPPGSRVVEVGSGSGDLLAALRPAAGVGVDISREMVELARSRHPDLRFERIAGETMDLGETFEHLAITRRALESERRCASRPLPELDSVSARFGASSARRRVHMGWMTRRRFALVFRLLQLSGPGNDGPGWDRTNDLGIKSP